MSHLAGAIEAGSKRCQKGQNLRCVVAFDGIEWLDSRHHHLPVHMFAVDVLHVDHIERVVDGGTFLNNNILNRGVLAKFNGLHFVVRLNLSLRNLVSVIGDF